MKKFLKSRVTMFVAFAVFVAGIGFSATTITKGLIGMQDFHLWSGTTADKTFTRATSTGGTMTLNSVGSEVDLLMSYGGGVSYTKTTIEAAKTAIGTSNLVTLLARPGVWTITDNTTIPENISLRVPAGASFTISTGKTLTINGPFDAGLYQVFTLVGTGTVRFGPGKTREIVPQWWGASVTTSAASNSVAFQGWLDSVGTYPATTLYIPGITLSSASNYLINVSLVKTSADYIRIRGDGPGSRLQWTGSSSATMLDLRGVGSGFALIEGVRFDLNSLATTGLELSNFGHILTVQNCTFLSGLANATDDRGMLNIPLDGESHNGRIIQNWFSGGTAIGIGLGLTGASSGSGGFIIDNNEFQQVQNWAIKSDGLKQSRAGNNVIDNLYAHTASNGFEFDGTSQVDVIGNHMEGMYGYYVKFNPTSRYASKPVTGRISGNYFQGSGSGIDLGYTDGVEVAYNAIMSTAGTNWLTVTANASGTVAGLNAVSSTQAGSMDWAEQYITGAGAWTTRFAHVPVASTSALISLTSQSSSTVWISSSSVSTTSVPAIPANARGYWVHASIKSATTGARLDMVNAGNAPAWASRNTDTRVQFIEAQTAGKYNTGTFLIPVKNASYPDYIYYSIDSAGSTDTDVKIVITGYLMPS